MFRLTHSPFTAAPSQFVAYNAVLAFVLQLLIGRAALFDPDRGIILCSGYRSYSLARLAVWRGVPLRITEQYSNDASEYQELGVYYSSLRWQAVQLSGMDARASWQCHCRLTQPLHTAKATRAHTKVETHTKVHLPALSRRNPGTRLRTLPPIPTPGVLCENDASPVQHLSLIHISEPTRPY